MPTSTYDVHMHSPLSGEPSYLLTDDHNAEQTTVILHPTEYPLNK